MSKRLERAAIARRLQTEGLIIRDIAKEMGISRSYASALINDPDGSHDRERKKGYRGTCEDCGGHTSWKKGGSSRFCHKCAARNTRYWTNERVIEAILRFAELNGRRPVATEWLSKGHGVNGDGYPNTGTVMAHFGSWANAIEAAGFPRPQLGAYVIRDRKEVARERGLRQRAARPGFPLEHWSLEKAAELVKKLSPWGVAPASGDGRVAALYRQARRNGVSWVEICEAAGVRPRGSRPY
jgi:transposase